VCTPTFQGRECGNIFWGQQLPRIHWCIRSKLNKALACHGLCLLPCINIDCIVWVFYLCPFVSICVLCTVCLLPVTVFPCILSVALILVMQQVTHKLIGLCAARFADTSIAGLVWTSLLGGIGTLKCRVMKLGPGLLLITRSWNVRLSTHACVRAKFAATGHVELGWLSSKCKTLLCTEHNLHWDLERECWPARPWLLGTTNTCMLCLSTLTAPPTPTIPFSRFSFGATVYATHPPGDCA